MIDVGFIFESFSIMAAGGNLITKHAETITMIKPYVVFAAVAIVVVMGSWNSSPFANKLRSNRAKNNRPARSRTNELGSGDLAPKSLILNWTKDNDEYDTKLPVRGLRGSEGIALKEGYLVIPREERNRHILIIAKTGSGKTTRMILPVLFSDCLNKHRSTVVLDSKPEMWDKLSGFTRKFCPEKKILLFNPLDTARSMSWNILGKVETDTDAKLIANTIIMATDNPSSKSDSPFFRNNALQLVNSIMCGLLADPNDLLSMPRVHELVHSGMKGLCDWLEAHPTAIRNSRTFVELARSGSQNADTIMSELGMRLAAWDLKAIRATTALMELDLEHLVNEPTLLIIELRESELEMLRPMANVIIVEVLRFLTKRAEDCPGHALKIPVGLVIDEFASALGRLPDIHVKLNTLRSRNVSIVGAIQSIAQVKANYDKDADPVLSGFSTKIFMPSLDYQDSEWASKETGTMTVRFNVRSMGSNKRLVDYFSHKNDNTQEQVQQRPVLTPDEIGRPADNIATFFMPNTPVFQGHLVPFYKVSEMLKRLDMAKNVNVNLRVAPIAYEEHDIVVASTSDVPGSNMTEAQMRQALEENKVEIGHGRLSEVACSWWKSFEEANADNLIAVFNLTEELKKRGVSIEEFYQIYATTGLQDVTQILTAIDQHQYNKLKDEIGWQIISSHAKDWWVAFEEANSTNFPVVVELAKELKKRQVNIDNFFNAYVNSEYETIPDILGAIDRQIVAGQIGPNARHVESKNNKDDTDHGDSKGLDDLYEDTFDDKDEYVAPVDTRDNSVDEEERDTSKGNRLAVATNVSLIGGSTVRLEAPSDASAFSLSLDSHDVNESKDGNDSAEDDGEYEYYYEDEDGEDGDDEYEDDEYEDEEDEDEITVSPTKPVVQSSARPAVKQSTVVNVGVANKPRAQEASVEHQRVVEPRIKEPQQATKPSKPRSVALNTYLAMGEDLLKSGKAGDYDSLITMARQDNRFGDDDIDELMMLRERYRRA